MSRAHGLQMLSGAPGSLSIKISYVPACSSNTSSVERSQSSAELTDLEVCSRARLCSVSATPHEAGSHPLSRLCICSVVAQMPAVSTL